jgi:hypothetical protein
MVVHPGGRIMANVNQPVASAEVYESLFQALVTLIRMVMGEDGKSPRFFGYKIVDKVKGVIADGQRLYREGKYSEAIASVAEAEKAIKGTERFYARNSVKHYLGPKIAGLLTTFGGNIDPDLDGALKKRLRIFEEALRVMDLTENPDMNDVSRKYWDLLELIESIPAEMKRREEKRKKEQIETEAAQAAQMRAQREEAQRRAEEVARNRRIEEDAERRKRREERARDMQSQLAALGI